MPKSSSEYIVKEALLSAEKSFGPSPYGDPIDIYGMIAEVSIFESIDKPYLTASLVLVDTQEVISEIVDFQGTEKLKLTVSTNTGSSENEFTLNLRFVSIVSETNPNDYSTAYHINCISEYAYDNANVQISRSYTGQLEDISEKILKDYLDVEMKRDSKYWEGESIQGRLKLIVPYMSPLESVSWLTERACKKDAAPIFMWSTIWEGDDNPKVRLGDFSTMCVKGSQETEKDVGKKGKDQKRSFVYVQSAPNSIGEGVVTTEANANIISEFKNGNGGDTLKMIAGGAVGSRMATLDTYTTQKFDRHFNLEEFLDFYNNNLSLSGDIFEGHFDEDDEVTVSGQKKGPSEFDARGRNFITSYGTYEWENSYHDVPDPTAAMNKVRKNVIRQLYTKDTMEVTVPGHHFFIEELGAGDVIRLIIPRTFTDDEGAEKKSTQNSGFYLILALRHVFISNTHRVVATCAKIQDDPS